VDDEERVMLVRPTYKYGDLLAEDVDDRFFPAEWLRALIGVVLYVAAGVLGYLIAPLIAAAIFLILPVFYGLTSTGCTSSARPANGWPARDRGAHPAS
jgi:hypothetical protein